MDTKLLKQKILDLAIHGKLVPQNPNDESATVLLEKIRAEKAEKIKKGELKADKKDSFIFVGDDNRHYEKFADGSVKDIEDEIPFDVPEGWAWCHFKDICTVFGRIGFRGYTRDDLVNKGEGAVSLSPSNLINMKLNFEDCTYLSWYKYEESPEIQLNINDIVVVKTGSSYGKAALVDILPEKTTLNPQLMVLKQLHCNSKYLCYLLNTQYMKKSFEDLVNGTAIPTFSQEKFGMKYFPLPPAKEQNVIVAKIEEIFAQIDSLEKDKSDLQSTIKQAKSKILDLAIHGKLVPQDSSDEPAYVLLERLRAEKEAKIKAGELKRNKNDSYIYKNTTDNCYYEKFNGKDPVCIDEEIPFDIPENWQWTKLGRICTKLVDGDHNPPKGIEEKTDYIMASSRNINHNTVEDLGNVRYLTKEMFEIENQRTKATEGDIFFTSVGTLGRSCIYDGSLNICFQRSVSILNTQIDKNYLKYFFDSNFYQDYVVEHATGTAQLGFYLQEMSESYIAIPPISEQTRIVSKIEEIFERLDQIQCNLI